jgi:ApaG protein
VALADAAPGGYRSAKEAKVSTAETRGIRVEVTPQYLPDQSEPRRGMWMFAYDVRIYNGSPEAVQLEWRHWVITDAAGRVEEVNGPGVVGEQPLIQPGRSYQYRSGCPLPTPMGTMHGTYRMVTAKGERFEATIAPFTLAEPYSLN